MSTVQPANEVPGLVSVVIPTYERAYIIGKTIESVLNQTYRHVEVIVIDDGSTDNTAQLVARYGDRVRYQRQANAGVSAARNTGLGIARGEFVAFLDSDDQWLPWKLEAQVAFLRKFPTAGMVWTDMVAIDDTEETVSPAYLRTFYSAYNYVTTQEMFAEEHKLSDVWSAAPATLGSRHCYVGDIFSAMLMGNLVHTSTVLMRRERVLSNAFDEAFRCGEDYKFHLQTCSRGPVGFLDVSSTIYRIGNSDQLTNDQMLLQFAENNLATIRQWTACDPNRNQLPARLWKQRMAESHSWLGREQLKAGQTDKARRELLASLSWKPAQPKTAALLAASLLPKGCLSALRGFKNRGPI